MIVKEKLKHLTLKSDCSHDSNIILSKSADSVETAILFKILLILLAKWDGGCFIVSDKLEPNTVKVYSQMYGRSKYAEDYFGTFFYIWRLFFFFIKILN